MMWNGFDGMGWGWIGLGFVHMLLFWALVILGIVVMARWLTQTRQGPSTRDRAMEVLRERYARGELSPEDFERMKRDLGS